MTTSKATREKKGQHSKEDVARLQPRSRHGPTWFGKTVKGEVWILAVFLGLGLATVLVASFLASVGGPTLDLNSIVGAVVLVATTILLALLVLSRREPGDDFSINHFE